MCEISVIIPMYNTEKYIEQCLKSVIRSVLFEYCEVLIIDDGSSDQSAVLAQNIVDRYDNMFIYHYENGGLSAARNQGLRLAKGKYIFFLDSDDYLEKNYLYQLYKIAKKTDCDVVFSGFSEVTENGILKEEIHRTILNHTEVKSGCEYLHARMNLGDWYNQVWCALYRKAFLQEKNLYFKEEVQLYEDILFTNQILVKAQKVCAIPFYGYMYRNRPESLVHGGVQERDIIACINVLKYLEDIYRKLDVRQKKVMGRVFFEHISMTLYYIGIVNPVDKKKYYHALSRKKVMKILKVSIKTPVEWIKYLIFRYFIWAYYPLVRKKSDR